jgi:GNAT superfamily N-acetyltransferase
MLDNTLYIIATDKSRLDMKMLHGFLVKSYWSPGIPLETMKKAIENSICFGAYDQQGRQVGFARAVTDKATFAYLADVFVLPEHRGQGISRLLMEAYTTHPELQGLRRHMLATSDGHGLYKKYGFVPVPNPEILMQRHDPEVYKRDQK